MTRPLEIGAALLLVLVALDILLRRVGELVRHVGAAWARRAPRAVPISVEELEQHVLDAHAEQLAYEATLEQAQDVMWRQKGVAARVERRLHLAGKSPHGAIHAHVMRLVR